MAVKKYNAGVKEYCETYFMPNYTLNKKNILSSI